MQRHWEVVTWPMRVSVCFLREEEESRGLGFCGFVFGAWGFRLSREDLEFKVGVWEPGHMVGIMGNGFGVSLCGLRL